MSMAMLQQIAQIKSHHQEHQQDTEITVLTQDNAIDLHLAIPIMIGTVAMIIGTDTGLTGRDPTPTIIDTGVTVAVTHKEVALCDTTNPHATECHATECHATDTQVHIATNETLRTEDPHHTEVFPGIAVDPDLTHHTNMTTKHRQNCLTSLTRQPGKTRTRNINK